MFTIIRCETCGRVFPYYGESLTIRCKNEHLCGAVITISKSNTIDIDYDVEKMKTLEIKLLHTGKPQADLMMAGFVFVNVFNNNSFLAARVFSNDGLNAITVSLNPRFLGVSKGMVDRCITSVRYQTARDGTYTDSGLYALSQETKDILNKQLFRGDTDGVTSRDPAETKNFDDDYSDT